MSYREQAKDILKFYIGDFQGKRLSYDNDAELDHFVDLVIDEAVEEATQRVIDRLRERIKKLEEKDQE